MINVLLLIAEHFAQMLVFLFVKAHFGAVKIVLVLLIFSTNVCHRLLCIGARQEAAKLFELISKCYAAEKEIILRNLPDELRSHFVASLSQ